MGKYSHLTKKDLMNEGIKRNPPVKLTQKMLKADMEEALEEADEKKPAAKKADSGNEREKTRKW